MAEQTQMATHMSFSHLDTLFQSAGEAAARPANIGPQVARASPTTPQNDSEKMWTEYLKEAEKYDNRAAEGWTKDADGLLVFTGLFSATVGAFIIEFYKKLSPDSGDQTVALLCQISQQLPNFTNGTCSTPQPGQLFSSGASIIWVNAMWVMSLSLSLTAALFATLLQQWARRYVEIPQVPDEPKRRACVRSFLFFGAQRYKMHIAVETVPTLLHLSVFLFFAGLVVLFFTIHKAVAIIVSISVGIFVVAYFTLTILPYLRHNCPYRTPMSSIWWYISHSSLFTVSLCFHRLFRKLHSWLVPYNLGELVHFRQRIIVPVVEKFARDIEKHARRLKAGFRETIMQGALEVSASLDVKALSWWLRLPAIAEEGKAQDFFACLPKQTVPRLMCDPIGKSIFLKPLLALLRSCQQRSLAVGLHENERRTRLLVCLHTIHHIAQDCINQNSDADVEFVRSNFANIDLMRSMWADSDVGIRITSRSICALLARRLLGRGLLEELELLWLQGVIGESPNTLFNADSTTRDNMNLKAFVDGVFAHQGGDLLTEHATSFTETLAILMGVGTQSPFDRFKFQTQLSALISRTEQDTAAGSTEVVLQLRRIFKDYVRLPASMAAQQP